jgi:CrcB protein
LERLLWVCLGGALGSGARYLVAVAAARAFGTSFPWATLIVNVLGCFFIAAVMHAATATAHVGPTLKLALTTGFLGGLTTYSAFNYETTQLAADRGAGAALLNLTLTLVLCAGAGLLGDRLARHALGV